MVTPVEANASELCYRQLADAMPQLVWTADAQGVVDYYNVRIHDYDPTVLHGDAGFDWQCFVHPDDLPVTLVTWQAAQQSGAYATEHRLRMADDSWRWHLSRAVLAHAANGEAKWYGTATDIHDRKVAEQALRESEARFRMMADTAPAMLWITDQAGSCIFLSHGWYQFTGQTEATGLGHGWAQAVHPDDQPYALQAFLKANAAHEPFHLDYRLRHVSGDYRWTIDAGHPRFGDDGAFLGYIGSVIDITARKQAEEELRRSEERYRYLFEAMDEGFCVLEMLFDAQGEPVDYRFLELNPAFERYTGLQQAVGKTALELVPDLEKHWVEIYGSVALTGKPLRFEQGSAAMGRWFDVYAFRVGDPTSHRVALLFKDITADKVAAEQLHTLNATLEQRVQERTAQLERSNRELDQFAYVASHDLKAPLRGIEHLATWIADDAQHILPAGSRAHLTKLRERVQRMERLLNDLLAYSRVGRRDGTPETVDMTALINDTVALLAPPAGFTVLTLGELPALVTPKTPLAIVLRNLIGNGIKHHHQPASGKVEISVQPRGAFVEFCVRDNGPGIDPQYHERIFGVFQTLQPRDHVEGSGMGLALVKKTVEYRGGAVRVESTGREGTAFYFTWPSVL